MDRLKSENEALIKRLKDLESSGVVGVQAGMSRGEELVPRESWEVLQKEKEELEEVVKQKEKRLLRLQQVYGSLRLIPSDSNMPSAGVHGQECRVPRGDRIHSRTQACVLPERTSEGDVDIRPVCVVCLSTAEQDERGWRWGANAAGRAGRRRATGSPAADALLGGGGTMHTGIPCECNARVLRQVEAGCWGSERNLLVFTLSIAVNFSGLINVLCFPDFFFIHIGRLGALTLR